MKQHKWHKEIKAWADGAEIQERFMTEDIKEIKWRKTLTNPLWDCDDIEFRIKPQKTEPLIISEEPVAVVYSMQDGYVGQMIKKGLPHKTLLYAHQDKPQPKEPNIECNCYGDGNVYRGTRSSDSTIKTYTYPQDWLNQNPITQPKEPQYLYIWNVFSKIVFTQDKNGVVIDTWDTKVLPKYLGKIKLEAKDD